VPTKRLQIDGARFRAADLTQSLHLDRAFELAVCVEVAEHLPAEAAPILIASLTTLAPVVLFSAAVPQQGGTGHVNEQWPAYWNRLFAAHGYVAADTLRTALWHDARVAWWYSQNLMFFVRRSRLGDYPALERSVIEEPPALVHPGNQLAHADLRSESVRELLVALPRRVVRRLKALLGWS
jgi:hypothetical protein